MLTRRPVVSDEPVFSSASCTASVLRTSASVAARLLSRWTETLAAADPACWMPAMRDASMAPATLATWVMYMQPLYEQRERLWISLDGGCPPGKNYRAG